MLAIHRELSVVRAQLAAVVDERNGLREDLRGVRERCGSHMLGQCIYSLSVQVR